MPDYNAVCFIDPKPTKKKVLIAALHRPNRSPSQRFRIDHYLKFLEENGFEFDYSYLISAADDYIFYSKGHYFGKARIVLKSILKRMRDLRKLSAYDLIFVQREAFMLGTAFFEKRYARSRAKLIFDFDDAIWLHQVSENNKKFSFLKNAGKTAKIIEMADMVIAGNEYLADYARRYNKSVTVIPTTLDTEWHQPREKEKDDRICIGWSGSMTTVEHFEWLVPVLIEVKKRWGNLVYFKLLGDGAYVHEELGIQGLSWSLENEIPTVSSFDIGIMPLPDDAWTRGKCGFKGLLYMALGVPTVMAAVGVNKEIVRHSENGFLASTPEEWLNCLHRLIESATLRKQLGDAGRQTVVDRYSVRAWRETYLRLFREQAH